MYSAQPTNLLSLYEAAWFDSVTKYSALGSYSKSGKFTASFEFQLWRLSVVVRGSFSAKKKTCQKTRVYLICFSIVSFHAEPHTKGVSLNQLLQNSDIASPSRTSPAMVYVHQINLYLYWVSEHFIGSLLQRYMFYIRKMTMILLFLRPYGA